MSTPEPSLPWDLNNPLITELGIHFAFWIAKLLARRYPQIEQRSWACMKCGASCGPERPRGGMCKDCQWDFQAYLQEVA